MAKKFTLIYFLFSCIALTLVKYDNTNAGTLNIVGGELVGASGVSVNGIMYDVSFVDDSAENLFLTDQGFVFTFKNSLDAQIAGWALEDQVMTGIYDSHPYLIYGIEQTDLQYAKLLIPYTLIEQDYPAMPANEGDILAIAHTNDYSERPDGNGWVWLNPGEDTTQIDNMVWTIWAEATSVPEPGTIVLIGLGFLSIAGIGRTRHFK